MTFRLPAILVACAALLAGCGAETPKPAELVKASLSGAEGLVQRALQRDTVPEPEPVQTRFCAEKVGRDGADALITSASLNQRLLSDIVTDYVNVERCNLGLVPVGSDMASLPTLASHSRWMAENGRISHTGANTFRERLDTSGLSFLIAAENVGQTAVHAFEEKTFRILDQANCIFEQKGQVVPVHSYETLAQTIVALWMDSDLHRNNILNPDVTRSATAAQIGTTNRACGDVFLTQMFLDDGPVPDSSRT